MLTTKEGMSNVNGALQTGMQFTPLFSKGHTDSNTLLAAFGGDGTNSMYLGMLKLWSQYNMLSAPLISMTELEGNILYTNGFNTLLGFTVPYNVGFPKVIENLAGDLVKPGIGGQAFPLVLTEAYAIGDVITNDYRNGRQLLVTNEEVTPYGNGWKHMVKLATMDEEDDYFPPHALEPGTPFMKIDNPSGEYDTNLSKVSNITRTGILNYSYQTGGAEISIGHWITSNGDILEVTDAQQNPNLNWLAQYGNLADKKGIVNLFNYTKDANGKSIPIAGSNTWMPSIIMAMQIELALMKERRLMWGQGFMLEGNGRAKTRVAPGYYQQIKNRGNYETYNDVSQLPNKLKNIVGQLFANRTDIPYHKRKVKFRMGMGAMIAMQQEFMTQFKSGNPFTVMADHPSLVGMLSGSFQDLSYKPIRITSVQYPEGDAKRRSELQELKDECTSLIYATKGNKEKQMYICAKLGMVVHTDYTSSFYYNMLSSHLSNLSKVEALNKFKDVLSTDNQTLLVEFTVNKQKHKAIKYQNEQWVFGNTIIGKTDKLYKFFIDDEDMFMLLLEADEKK